MVKWTRSLYAPDQCSVPCRPRTLIYLIMSGHRTNSKSSHQTANENREPTSVHLKTDPQNKISLCPQIQLLEFVPTVREQNLSQKEISGVGKLNKKCHPFLYEDPPNHALICLGQRDLEHTHAFCAKQNKLYLLTTSTHQVIGQWRNPSFSVTQKQDGGE